MTRFETAVEPTKGRFGIPLQRRLGRLVDAAGPVAGADGLSVPVAIGVIVGGAAVGWWTPPDRSVGSSPNRSHTCTVTGGSPGS